MQNLSLNNAAIKQMRILSVIETLGRGGAEQALLNLLPALQTRGHICEVAVLFPPYDLAVDFEACGIRVHRLGLSHRWNLVQGVGRLLRIMQDTEAEIVHAHLFFSGFYVALTKWLAPQPARVVSFHNLGYGSFPATTLWKRLRKKMDAWLMRHGMDARVGVSQVVAKHYQLHLRLDEVSVIFNALSFDKISQSSPIYPEFLAGHFGVPTTDYAIMPGRLVSEKAHLIAIHALARLKRQGVRPFLVIVGSGPLQHSILQEILALGLEDQVKLLPAINQAELFSLIQSSRFVLQASIYEGFSLVAAEAHALGVPVVATRVGAIPEIVSDGKSGLLVEPNDETALAEAIAQMWQHPEWKERMGFAGSQLVEKLLNPDVVAMRWEEHYMNLISRKKTLVGIIGSC